MRYDSGTNSAVTATLDLALQTANGNAALTGVEVSVSLGGVNSDTFYFDATGVPAEDVYRFSVPVSALSLTTGRHYWEMTVVQRYDDGSELTESYFGSEDVVKTADSPFGMGWGLSGVGRLFSQQGGVAWAPGGGRWTAGTAGHLVHL